ncbi:hypothetical protein Runsl_5854 (plasmid) [Runella slithyformis DSM 19594]|uniref:Uncharacterized protein n=1 Tax=Runella slithyformis (strain ATCC 29530 / DSM 19594 / LMG 11500 / NCIMB 11436 / LSU 4) TaxID=761193 RepID=A0A7U4E901_RUNSL|nr:hypothetical protein Runsl_5854 [Runella slithyformis DSM 19594]
MCWDIEGINGLPYVLKGNAPTFKSQLFSKFTDSLTINTYINEANKYSFCNAE